MKILVAGAGSVGRSISRELISHGHEVTLVDRAPDAMRISSVPDADWQLADACDVDALAEAVTAGGGEVRWDEAIPGVRRFHTDDPVGNRVELQQA